MLDDSRGAVSVDEDARRRFEEFWAKGNPHPIEEFLPDEMLPSYVATLEELVLIDQEFSWRTWSRRQAESGQSDEETVAASLRVETYVARFSALRRPDIVRRLVLEEISLCNRYGPPPRPEEYQQRFPQIELPDAAFSGMGNAADETISRPVVPAATQVEEETLPRRFGPYRLTERIGAGGMGVVYRAWQEGVEREIAVKVLRTDRLAGLPSGCRQELIDRFRNEARATARIDHPGIVSIHDVGEADGIPYYTMKYVTGASLDDVRQSSLPGEREAARIIQAAARAVQAAHDHGILHRDLKPQNILIEETSRAPVVADFGLAKLLEDDASRTVTGEILGTPQYMSPEQATDSGSVTVRSDVYSLGATLYFLLTGKPPFSGRNPLEILGQVLDRQPEPPRRCRPGIDTDLEVICLKCLEKEPERRYASAGALARDLSCWMEGEPIAARPSGRWERVMRWCRKNPLPSSLAATVAASVVFGVVALGTGYTKATTARIEAEASDQRARATINEFFTVVSEDVLINQPGMQPLRRELLQKALTHYLAFVDEHENDSELSAELAATHFRVGKIRESLESSEAALASYRQAVAIQKQLHIDHPENPDITRDLSGTLNALGACLTSLDRADEAFAAFQEARTLRQSLVDDDGNNVEYRRLLANTVMNTGSLHRKLEQFGEAKRHYEASIDMRSELLEGARPPRKVLRDQGMAYFNLGNVECDQVFLAETFDNAGMAASAAGHLERAIECFQHVLERTPEDLEVRRAVAMSYLVLGEIGIKQQEFSHAEAAYAAALDWMRRLAAENPRVRDYQIELARALQMQGQCAVLLRGWDRALVLYSESCSRLRAVVEGGDADPRAKSDLVQSLHGLAVVSLEREERPQALATAREALKYARQLTADDSTEEIYAKQLRDVEQFINTAEARDE